MKSLLLFVSFVALLSCSGYAGSAYSIYPKANDLPEARIRVVPQSNTVNDSKKKTDDTVKPQQKEKCDKIMDEHPMIKDYLSRFQLNVQC